MSLATGNKFGPYEIVGPLGAAGWDQLPISLNV
jgi:hypothetical protein